MSSSRQHPQSPPTALPTLLAANYIPPPKSPLCMSASSPLVEAIAPPKSSSSNLLQPPQHATTVAMPTHSQPNSSSIIARRRIPTPLPLISVREMPTTPNPTTVPTHSPLRALFSSSSNNSSSYYSPSSPSPIRFSPASFSGSTSQLFILLNSPKNNVSTSSSTCALSPFLGENIGLLLK
uniref:Uncharacterized protein n=1 Tax=Meloidogyne enterolobii TaxID=390850 RepID=A0A6V7UI02_MELEN|nr:unnamed protein product [Meloidogyne enterolobii]